MPADLSQVDRRLNPLWNGARQSHAEDGSCIHHSVKSRHRPSGSSRITHRFRKTLVGYVVVPSITATSSVTATGRHVNVVSPGLSSRANQSATIASTPRRPGSYGAPRYVASAVNRPAMSAGSLVFQAR